MSATSPPSAAPAVDVSFRGIARLLAQALPGADIIDPDQPSFDALAAPPEPARTISAEVIEGRELLVHRVFDPPMPGIAAFLDGTQASRAVHYLADGTPIVHGTAAAVIRERRNKRLYTWRHLVVRRLYLSRERVPASLWGRLARQGIELRDTSERAVGEEREGDSTHPLALREAAIHVLQKDRKRAEQSLALEWCARENRPILIDGGISDAEPVARAGCAIGVVKSHRTLYADGEALTRVFGLRRGERSSVFRVTSTKRATVASWYLRLRDRHGHDPMWGLVRVEVAAPGRTRHDDIGGRADEASRWILAEATPVALPDARWDKMVYGIHDCEEFLRAVV